MIQREDIIMLGIRASVIGSLTSGLLLGIGLGLAVQGANIGWLLVIPAAPAAGLIGWLMARRVAKDL